MTRITLTSGYARSAASGAWFLTARFCLAAVFVYSGAAKLLFWSDGNGEFAALGLPLPTPAMAAPIALQIGAGTTLAIGWSSGPAALARAAFHVAMPVGAGAGKA